MRFRRYFAAAAALALTVGGVAVAGAGPAGAATGCSVSYTVQSQWNTGFVAAISITNLGSPITSWTLGYSYSGNQQLSNGWSGTWSQSGKNVTVTNASWNGSLGTNGSTQIGAQFTYSGTNTNPTTFSLNGTTCTGQVGASLMESASSLSMVQGASGTVGISLSTAPSANVTVTTSRTSGNTGLSVSGGGSLTFTPANFATAQNVTISADASSTGTATFTVSATGYTSITFTANETAGNTGGPAPQLHVSGNKLVNAGGQQVILRGINRSGGEYACVNGTGVFDGEMDQAAISAMKSWGVNAVRMPLNEACWNGESYVNSQFAGANYVNTIKSEVSLMNSNGLDVILDLHWTDGAYSGNSAGNCGSHNPAQAFCQKPMPDAAQAIPFWTSVATAFKGNNAVIFDLFNEPFASRADNNNSTEGWQCWATGSPCTGINYPVAGMQQMINAVRGAGAGNVIMLGGEEYSNDLTSWLANEPKDPNNNLVASWHSYNFNTCSSQSCWTSQVAPVIAQVPVIAGEIGENDCAGSYINPLTTWLDSQNTSYLAWAWNADFDCSSGPGLVTDYVPGTPTNYGAAYKAHLASLGL
jgi:endoglucanase